MKRFRSSCHFVCRVRRKEGRMEEKTVGKPWVGREDERLTSIGLGGSERVSNRIEGERTGSRPI